VAAINEINTSLGKYLQNDTEPVKDLNFPESLPASFFDDRLNIFALKLSLGLKLASIGFDVYVAYIVDFGLNYFGKIPDLGRLKLFIDEKAVHLIIFYMICNRVQLALCEIRSLGHPFCLD
jgi:hypothetical protein